MKFVFLLKIAYQSLIANWRRTLLTMFGIIVGVSSVILILSLGNGIKRATIDQFHAENNGELATNITYIANNSQDSETGITSDDVNRIKEKLPTIKKITMKNSSTGFNIQAEVGRKQTTVTTSLLNIPSQKFELLFGRYINSNDIIYGKTLVLISSKIAKEAFRSAQNAIGGNVVVHGQSYTIVGVFKKDVNSTFSNGSDLIIPHKSYKRFSNINLTRSLAITFTNGSDINKDTKKVITQLTKFGTYTHQGKYNYINQGETLKSISNVMNGITYFIGSVAGISLIIAGIGVMNMMFITVSERKQEIGIRLAFGASKRDILIQFLLESLMLTTIGGIVGFFFGFMAAKALSLLLPFKSITTFTDFIFAFLVSLAVGTIFGLLPAKKAANKNLIDILK